MESTCRVYRPRDPRKTPLWGLLDTLYERVKGSWEERFERKYGFRRGLADEAVARYLDCGVWDNGFARVKCRRCPQEFLVAFSCYREWEAIKSLGPGSFHWWALARAPLRIFSRQKARR